MILLKELKLNNFLSHEDTSVYFKEGDKILLDGASGAGKSSIFDAIVWALYGQGRANNKNLVRVGAEKASVSLKLEGPNVVTTVTRTISQKNKHTLTVSMKEGNKKQKALPLSGVREIQNWIDKDLIGASYLLFINSVAYMQGNADSFVVQTAQKRKELLLEIIKADSYKKYYKNAKGTISKLDKDKSELMGRLSELNARKGQIEANGRGLRHAMDVESKQKEMEETKVSLSSLRDKEKGASNTARDITLIEEHIASINENIKSMEAELREDTGLIQKGTELRERFSGIESPDDEMKKTYKKIEAANLENEKTQVFMRSEPIVPDFTTEIETLAGQIKDLFSKPKCPSGDKCPYSKNIPGQIKALTENIDKFQSLVLKKEDELIEWKKKAKTMEVIDTAKYGDRLADLALLKSVLDTDEKIASKVIKHLREKEKVAELEKSKKKKEKSLGDKELETIVSHISDLEDRLSTIQHDIARSIAIIEEKKRGEEETRVIDEKIKTIEKGTLPKIDMKLRQVELAKGAFAPRGGVETMVIDYLLPKLEDKINEILSKLSDFRVRLDTQRTGLDGENTIEGLFITILNERNDEMPFEAYSGGEKLKIMVAIQEALASLQNFGCRLMDENIIALDANSVDSFVAVMDGLISDFPQLIMISHVQNIKALFDKKINIFKTNNISKISHD